MSNIFDIKSNIYKCYGTALNKLSKICFHYHSHDSLLLRSRCYAQVMKCKTDTEESSNKVISDKWVGVEE